MMFSFSFWFLFIPACLCSYGDDSKAIRGMWLRTLKRHAGKHIETMSEYELSQLERQKRLSNVTPTPTKVASSITDKNTPKTPQEEYEESIRERKRRLRAAGTNSFDSREQEISDVINIST